MTSYISFKDVLEQPVQTVLVDDYDVEEHLSGQLCDIVDIPRNFNSNGSIKLHFFEDFCYDGRRVWQLFYVTFHDKPVMICHAAGREGSDVVASRVFDLSVFSDMVMFIAEQRDFYDIDSLKNNELNKVRHLISITDTTLVSPTDDATSFINFYSNKLNDVFSNW